MRMLFIILAKLLGIYEVFRWLLYIVIHISRAIRAHSFSGSLISTCCIYGLGLLLALILIFKAERIAYILRVPRDQSESFTFDARPILRGGLLLIGVAMLMRAAPDVIGLAGVMWAVESAEEVTRQIVAIERYQPELYCSGLQVVFAGCLILFARRLACLFVKPTQSRIG